MVEPTTDMGRKLAALTQRLRVLHSELADQNSEIRMDQLRDEVQRAVAAVPPPDREAFLGELMLQFPVWVGNGAASAAPAKPAAGTVRTVVEEVRDPKVLAERLAAAWGGMGDAERAAVLERLGPILPKQVEAAPAPTSGGPVPEALKGELRRALSMPSDASMDQHRVLEIAALLAEFALKLEPWACTYWQTLAPDARVKIPPALKKELVQYASGDDKLNKEQLAKSIYKLRSLVSLLLKAAVDSGKQFARDHVNRFAPEAVQQAAPRGGAFKSQAVCNWEQYVKMMEGMDADGIEARFKQVIAKDVDAGLAQVIKV